MAERPYVLLSCAMSIDGYLDDGSGERLLLSNEADLDRVDAVRAGCDAILVGAATIRNDDPRLVVRSPARRARRAVRGLRPTPVKVTVTERAKLDPGARFFAVGDSPKLVYCASDSVEQARDQLGPVATVVDGGQPVSMRRVCEDLHRRGIGRLMVEGGGTVLTQFLAAGLADELQLVVAPFFVGAATGRRLVDEATFPWQQHRPARLVESRALGDVVLLRYALSRRFRAPCP
jgi:5-amino-6-(5-phosphoribosylamino)uracil reductase